MFNQKGLVGILIIIVVVFAMAVGAGVYWWQSQEVKEQRQKLERRIEQISKTLEDLRKEIKKPVEKVQQVVEGKVTIISPRGTIKVTDPQPGEAIKSPVKIAGKASVFEANIQLQVKNASGRVLGKGFTTASMGAPEWGDFEEDFKFDTPPKTQVGTVEFYTEDAATGDIDDLVTIPVLLKAE